ncbi:hypothetical protein [Cohnella boryungensis]|uniref:Uncharacterized protein n=1 Tax=Cohnella boryungensis TaxID=768479 RepID=A0ABV8S737_9BACL
MDKLRYYVSVSAGIVGTEPALTDQLTVLATDEERNHLIALLEKERKALESTYVRAPIPYKSADHDSATNRYNDSMIEIYRFIYRIGTIETKRHIEYMDILRELRTPDYRHPGY